MILTLRQAIYKRLEEKSADDIYETIEDAVDNDERTLPGLGVLFELAWKHTDKKTQQKLVKAIKEHLPQ